MFEGKKFEKNLGFSFFYLGKKSHLENFE